MLPLDERAPLARRLYQHGKSRQDVVRTIYGADLPQEAYRFHDGGLARSLPVEPLFHPWALLSPAEPDQPSAAIDEWSRDVESRALESDPVLIPLMVLSAADATFDGYVIGYRVDDLLAGATSIYGRPEDDDDASFSSIGVSLAATLREWMSDHARMLREQFSLPQNRGASAVDQAAIERALAHLRSIDSL